MNDCFLLLKQVSDVGWHQVASNMDLNKEVSTLKAQVKEEIAARHILEEWINSSLKSTLEKHHAELKRITVAYESKILALESQLEKEIAARKKLNVWLKEYLGPNLEATPFRDAVESISSSRRRAPSADSSSSVSAHVSRPPAASPAKKPSKQLQSPRKPSNVADNGEDSASSDEVGAAPPPASISASKAPSTTSKQSDAVSVVVAIPPIPVPNPVLKSRVQKLAALELALWGEDDVADFTFPSGDATVKTNKNRIEYYLQQQQHGPKYYSTPTLFDKTTLFMQKGAKVVFAPLSEVDSKRDGFNFAILSHDRLFPVCPDGLIRSQILYLVLQGVKRKLGMSTGVELPHGARFGFDPFILQDSGPQGSDSLERFEHIPAPATGREVTAFTTAFGVEKANRFGQEAAGHSLLGPAPPTSNSKPKQLSEADLSEISKNRRRMREYFDLYYYGSFKSASTSTTTSTSSTASSSNPSSSSSSSSSPASASNRIVFIAFGSSVPIVMDRLSEVNYRFDLSKVTLLALPYPTGRLTATDTKAEDYIAAYKLYASLFAPILESQQH